MSELARQTGYEGELHLSTLANVSHPAALASLPALGVTRVVMPRELNVDEIKAMAGRRPRRAGPGGLRARGAVLQHLGPLLVVELHGRQERPARGAACSRAAASTSSAGKKARFFSCNDLSLDVLVKALLDEPRVKSWKIEGRKKGRALRVLRHQRLPHAARPGQLARGAQGRPEPARTVPGPQGHALRASCPSAPSCPRSPVRRTGSGPARGAHGQGLGPQADALAARRAHEGAICCAWGYQDEPWHQTVRVTRARAQGVDGWTSPARKGGVPKPGTPVFLIDRREPELVDQLAALEKGAGGHPRAQDPGASEFAPAMPRRAKGRQGPRRGGQRQPQAAAQHAQGREVGPVAGPQDARQGHGQRATGGCRPSSGPARRISGPTPWPRPSRPEHGASCSARRWQVGLFERALKQEKGRPLELWGRPLLQPLQRPGRQGSGGHGLASAHSSARSSAARTPLALAASSPLPLGIRDLRPVALMGITPACRPEGFRTDKPMASPKGEVCWGPGATARNTWIFPGLGRQICATRNANSPRRATPSSPTSSSPCRAKSPSPPASAPSTGT